MTWPVPWAAQSELPKRTPLSHCGFSTTWAGRNCGEPGGPLASCCLRSELPAQGGRTTGPSLWGSPSLSLCKRVASLWLSPGRWGGHSRVSIGGGLRACRGMRSAWLDWVSTKIKSSKSPRQSGKNWTTNWHARPGATNPPFPGNIPVCDQKQQLHVNQDLGQLDHTRVTANPRCLRAPRRHS